jgi:hypothetical protein
MSFRSALIWNQDSNQLRKHLTLLVSTSSREEIPASRVQALLVIVTTFLLFSSASSSIATNPFSSYSSAAFLSFAIVHINKNGEDD